MSSAASTLAPAWGKGAMLVGLFFAACWGGSIIYWRATDRMPTTVELAFFLVGLPLLLSGGLWVSRRVLEPQGGPGAAPRSAIGGGESTSRKGLVILAGALCLPHGASADEITQLIKTHKARPDLDPDLRDDAGFPVMTARCASADNTEARDRIAEWLRANGHAGVQFCEEQWRALALASVVAEELAISSTMASTHRLHLVPIAGTGWTDEEYPAVEAWLRQVCIQAGWESERVAIAPRGPADVASALEVARRPTSENFVTMVLAFSSNIGDKAVAQWSANKTLLTPENQQGCIPGEGAAAVLISDADAVRADSAVSTAIVYPPETAKRDASDDNTTRRRCSVLTELVTQALNHAHAKPEQVTAIFADTGHRASRTLELMGIAQSLDETENVVPIGMATGSCDAVPALAALVMAAHNASVKRECALWVSNEACDVRAVALVTNLPLG